VAPKSSTYGSAGPCDRAEDSIAALPADLIATDSDWDASQEQPWLSTTPADVARLCPHALENVGLAGLPCWRREDLDALLDGRDLL
jgi:hypothetical protein